MFHDTAFVTTQMWSNCHGARDNVEDVLLSLFPATLVT